MDQDKVLLEIVEKIGAVTAITDIQYSPEHYNYQKPDQNDITGADTGNLHCSLT